MAGAEWFPGRDARGKPVKLQPMRTDPCGNVHGLTRDGHFMFYKELPLTSSDLNPPKTSPGLKATSSQKPDSTPQKILPNQEPDLPDLLTTRRQLAHIESQLDQLSLRDPDVLKSIVLADLGLNKAKDLLRRAKHIRQQDMA